MQLTIRRGTRDQALRFLLVKNDGNGGKVGLTALSEGLSVAYIRDGDRDTTRINLIKWNVDSHIVGGFREIDAIRMPGLYELGLPDEVCMEGANRATLFIQGGEISPRVIHIDLVGFDPYDRDRLGLDCLSREARHDVISRAFREVVPEIVEEFRRHN
jgi:hypothetical protein